mmetsp:Transcript_18215/g.45568  ORF Transcript_18215/g.45568 Transcript_18215/m.45568 type:complete len:210 (-) Transcript_18215:407-1036(-)
MGGCTPHISSRCHTHSASIGGPTSTIPLTYTRFICLAPCLRQVVERARCERCLLRIRIRTHTLLTMLTPTTTTHSSCSRTSTPNSEGKGLGRGSLPVCAGQRRARSLPLHLLRCINKSLVVVLHFVRYRPLFHALFQLFQLSHHLEIAIFVFNRPVGRGKADNGGGHALPIQHLASPSASSLLPTSHWLFFVFARHTFLPFHPLFAHSR